VWFAAHDAAGTIDDYLADVAMARLDSEHRTDDALGSGRPAASIAEELRYWLITASMASRTAVIPVELLVRLLQHKIWTSARAVLHPRRLPSPRDRANFLTSFLHPLPAEEQGTVAADALEAVAAMNARLSRWLVLEDLAPSLSAEQMITAVEVAGASTFESDRAEAMVALAPHLPAEQLATVLDAVMALAYESTRAQILAELAPHLSA